MSGSLDNRPHYEPWRLPDNDEGQVQLNDIIPGHGSLEIEIGPGRGAFLLERCAQEGGVRLLGIEIRRKWAAVLDERLRKLGHGRYARVICEDARYALPRLAPDASVDRFFIHFPDPWWKKKHQKRQVISGALLDEVARLLKDGGELFIQTDVEHRSRQLAEQVSAHPRLRPHGDSPGSPELVDSPYSARSNRERRVLADGLPIYRLRFARKP